MRQITRAFARARVCVPHMHECVRVYDEIATSILIHRNFVDEYLSDYAYNTH